MVAIRGLILNSELAALLPARQVKVEVVNGLLTVCPMRLSGTNREIGLTMRKNWQPTRIQNRFYRLSNNATPLIKLPNSTVFLNPAIHVPTHF
jgi:hypothetical protein